MANYCNQANLKAIIIQDQADGVMSDTLALIVYQIADGLAGGHKFTWKKTFDQDDYRQDCVLTIHRVLQIIDPNNNPFNYITSICFNTYRCNRRTDKKIVMKEAGAIQRCKAAGEKQLAPIPWRELKPLSTPAKTRLRQAAIAAYAPIYPEIKRLRDDSVSLQEIADHLNAAGHRTVKGNLFTKQAVRSILKRAGYVEYTSQGCNPAHCQRKRAERLAKYQEIFPVIDALEKAGLNRTEIATELNKRGSKPVKGNAWTKRSVCHAVKYGRPEPVPEPQAPRQYAPRPPRPPAEPNRSPFDSVIYSLIDAMTAEGKNYKVIADELNVLGKTTIRGEPWTQNSVTKLMQRSRLNSQNRSIEIALNTTGVMHDR